MDIKITEKKKKQLQQPILLAMLATLFWIIYPVKNPQEEADY